MKEKTHDFNHDLTFSAHTINCVCHSIRSMFRVLGIYNFGCAITALYRTFRKIMNAAFGYPGTSELEGRGRAEIAPPDFGN